MKRKQYVWYSVEFDFIFILDQKKTVGLFRLCVAHEFGYNSTLLFLGEL